MPDSSSRDRQQHTNQAQQDWLQIDWKVYAEKKEQLELQSGKEIQKWQKIPGKKLREMLAKLEQKLRRMEKQKQHRYSDEYMRYELHCEMIRSMLGKRRELNDPRKQAIIEWETSREAKVEQLDRKLKELDDGLAEKLDSISRLDLHMMVQEVVTRIRSNPKRGTTKAVVEYEYAVKELVMLNGYYKQKEEKLAKQNATRDQHGVIGRGP